MQLNQLDESTLVERAKTEPDAFGELYERYVDRIYNYIYYRVSSQEDAEDLTAHTFFQAMDNIGKYEDRGAPFSAWLYRIAHNVVANWHRHRSRHKSIPIDDVLGTREKRPGPGSVVEQKEAAAELIEAIQRLPEERQQLLLLKFVDRMPNSQIGSIMGRSESSIKSLYHRTLIALRDDFQARNLL